MRNFRGSCLWMLAAAVAEAQGQATPPRLQSAQLGPAPWNAVSGGIAAYDVRVDEQGAVSSAEIVQDVAPYGAMLGDALPSWRFEPARESGQPVASRVLVLGLFRPPGVTFAAPESPRYKTTVAPDDIPWPTFVGVPAYPLNALGSAKVVLEADVSDTGAVTSARVLTPPTPFDNASTKALRRWKFRPASRANREVASRAFLVFSFVGTTP
jgi:TonB family protein